MKKKKQAFKIWQRTKTEADEQAYREINKEAKKAVATTKSVRGPYKKLESGEGTKVIYKLAKTRHQRTVDIIDNIYIMDTNTQIVKDISVTWRRYFRQLLNVENPLNQHQQWTAQFQKQ